MTEPYGCSDLFFLLAVAHLKSHCLAWANILQSEGLCAKLGSEDITKKGKPIFSKSFFHYRKRGFPLLSKLSMKVIQATWKTSNAFFFSVFMLAKSSVMGTAWSLLVFRRKGDCLCVCMCFYTPDALWVLYASIVDLQRTCAADMSVKYQHLHVFSFFFNVTFASNVDVNKLPVSVEYTL